MPIGMPSLTIATARISRLPSNRAKTSSAEDSGTIGGMLCNIFSSTCGPATGLGLALKASSLITACATTARVRTGPADPLPHEARITQPFSPRATMTRSCTNTSTSLRTTRGTSCVAEDAYWVAASSESDLRMRLMPNSASSAISGIDAAVTISGDQPGSRCCPPLTR